MSKDSQPTSPCDCDGEGCAGSATAECPYCWNEDCEDEIDVGTYGRYFRKYHPDGSECSYSFHAWYKVYAPVHSSTTITVEVKFKPEAQENVTATDIATAKTRLETGVNTHWNNVFMLQADDPQCGGKLFNIVYRVLWVDDDEDYTMKVHDTYPREGVTGDVLDVSKTTSDWTYAHEFGHCVGVPDEYSYEHETQTVRHIKPDETLGDPVSAPFDGKPATEVDATIMSTVNSTVVLTRHAWNIAIEVQEILRDEFDRDITCTIM